MKRSLTFFVLLGALVSGPGAWTQQGPPADEPVAEVVSAWFVELQGHPQAKGGSAPELAREKHLFRAAARAAGVELRERYSFDRLWNGLSVEVTAAGLSRLTTLPEVKNVFPVAEVGLPEPEPASAPALETALAMTQADIAQSSLGLTGQGVRVAVMDTGVDSTIRTSAAASAPAAGSEGAGTSSATPTTTTHLTRLNPVPDPTVRTTATATARTWPASSAPTAAITGRGPGRDLQAPTGSSAATARPAPTSWSPPWSGSSRTAPTSST